MNKELWLYECEQEEGKPLTKSAMQTYQEFALDKIKATAHHFHTILLL